jgi:hypothetical protein
MLAVAAGGGSASPLGATIEYLRVVVKVLETDAFVLTAYLTDRIKRGVMLWPTNTNA